MTIIQPTPENAQTLEIYNMETEQLTLGCAMMDPSILPDIGFLQPDDFFLERHQIILRAIRAVAPSGTTDAVAVHQKIVEMKEDVGGLSYLMSLILMPMASFVAESYGRKVEELATRRRYLRAASLIAAAVHSEQSIAEIETEIARVIKGVGERHAATIDTSEDIADIALRVMHEAAVQAKKPCDLPGMTTGIKTLDEASDGVEKGLFYLAAARPGMGKSSALAQIALSLAKAGHRVGFFSLEMPSSMLVAKMICQESKVPSWKVRKGKMTKEETDRFVKAGELVLSLPLWIEAGSGLTVSMMQSIATRHEREDGLDVVVIDTVNRIGDISKKSDQYAGTTYVSHHLADWAHDSKYAIIGAAQLSRANTNRTDKRPTLADLRDTGAWEEDADVVWGIHRPGYYDRGNESIAHLCEVVGLKDRYGDSDFTVKLYWEKQWQGFAPLADAEQQKQAPPKRPQKQPDLIEVLKERDKKAQAAA